MRLAAAKSAPALGLLDRRLLRQQSRCGRSASIGAEVIEVRPSSDLRRATARSPWFQVDRPQNPPPAMPLRAARKYRANSVTTSIVTFSRAHRAVRPPNRTGDTCGQAERKRHVGKIACEFRWRFSVLIIAAMLAPVCAVLTIARVARSPSLPPASLPQCRRTRRYGPADPVRCVQNARPQLPAASCD
jgi:hypothetical protein